MTKLADSIFPIELERIFVLIFRLVLLPSKDLSNEHGLFLFPNMWYWKWFLVDGNGEPTKNRFQMFVSCLCNGPFAIYNLTGHIQYNLAGHIQYANSHFESWLQFATAHKFVWLFTELKLEYLGQVSSTLRYYQIKSKYEYLRNVRTTLCFYAAQWFPLFCNLSEPTQLSIDHCTSYCVICYHLG